jgi:hypothetical protein
MKRRIIDSHTHPTLYGKNSTRTEVGRIVSYGQSFGVEKMVVLGDVLLYGRLPNREQVQAINDKTLELTSWFPDYFVGFCFLNPTLGEQHVLAETNRCIRDRGMKGIKLEICNNASDDRWMRPIMNQALALGVPVLQHSADQTNISQRAYHSNPEDTALLGKRYPEARIIMAHLTACGMRGVRAVADIPNIYVDTSAYQPEYGLVEYALQKLGANRLLFGSDLTIRDLPVQIGRILGANLDEEAQDLIFYQNIQTLLNLGM